MSALAANFYPTRSRATGVAWMLGIGRMGAVTGALAGAMLMSMNLPFGAVFSLLAAPAAIAAVALGAMGMRDTKNALHAVRPVLDAQAD
jgi:AAHS family 4-hydroxybenzoate transporter-like MFS transporter